LADGIDACQTEIADLIKSGGEAIKPLIEPARRKANSLTPRRIHYKKNYSFQDISKQIKDALKGYTDKLPPKEAAELERVGVAQARLNNLRTQFQLQFQLRAWLSFHIVATAIMLTLLFVHVLTAVFIF